MANLYHQIPPHPPSFPFPSSFLTPLLPCLYLFVYLSLYVSLCELLSVSVGAHGRQVLDPLELELQATGVCHPTRVLALCAFLTD